MDLLIKILLMAIGTCSFFFANHPRYRDNDALVGFSAGSTIMMSLFMVFVWPWYTVCLPVLFLIIGGLLEPAYEYLTERMLAKTDFVGKLYDDPEEYPNPAFIVWPVSKAATKFANENYINHKESIRFGYVLSKSSLDKFLSDDSNKLTWKIHNYASKLMLN